MSRPSENRASCAGPRRAYGSALDLSRPVAVIFLGVLGHVPDDEQAISIVGQVMDAVLVIHVDDPRLGREMLRGLVRAAERGQPPPLVAPSRVPGHLVLTRWSNDTFATLATNDHLRIG